MTSFTGTDKVNLGLRRRDINFLRKWKEVFCIYNLRNLYTRGQNEDFYTKIIIFALLT